MKTRTAKARRAPWTAVLAAAAAAALWLAPMPHAAVETWYSRGLYPPWQRAATTLANFIPIAVFDLLLLAACAGVMIIVVRAARARAWRDAALRLLMVASLAAVWFQLAWGLNYRRTPIAETLRLTPAAAPGALQQFGEAVAGHVAATAGDLDRSAALTPPVLIAELSAGFDRAQARIGLTRHARPGRPKYSLFNPYFRWAAIDGVTNPFLPETIIVRGLVPAETYVTVAHEWAHLAGFASEDEANFLAWLTCLEAGRGATYNAWLFALTKAMGAAPPPLARAWLARAGPAAAGDLSAIRERVRRSSPTVRRAASAAYDQFLRANRVEEGIGSYDEVLKLMLAAAPGGRPRL